MGRHRVLILVLGSLMVLAAPGSAMSTLAQGDMGTAHPIEGSWLVRSIPYPDDQPSVVTFDVTGGVMVTSAEGDESRGNWAASGENTADITIWYLVDAGMILLRGAAEVDSDDASLTLAYTLELVNEEGSGGGEYGPGETTGERIATDGPGEPDGSLAAFILQVNGPSTVEVVMVEISEFAITSDRTTLIAGQPYVFVVFNAGALVHDFVIEPAGAENAPLLGAEGFTSDFQDLPPGYTAEFEWTFTDTGSYQFACHEEGHAEAGMILPVEVVEP